MAVLLVLGHNCEPTGVSQQSIVHVLHNDEQLCGLQLVVCCM